MQSDNAFECFHFYLVWSHVFYHLTASPEIVANLLANNVLPTKCLTLMLDNFLVFGVEASLELAIGVSSRVKSWISSVYSGGY